MVASHKVMNLLQNIQCPSHDTGVSECISSAQKEEVLHSGTSGLTMRSMLLLTTMAPVIVAARVAPTAPGYQIIINVNLPRCLLVASSVIDLCMATGTMVENLPRAAALPAVTQNVESASTMLIVIKPSGGLRGWKGGPPHVTEFNNPY